MDTLNRAFHVLMKALMKTTEIIPYTAPAKPEPTDTSVFKTNYPFIFVSGFWGWGQYKKGYETLPYWGFFTGENYVSSFNKSGYTFAAADVSPMGSAWDRACELYAQLTGTVVDYGRAHSEKFGHARYGEDYTGRALITNWDEKNKINIICHSFGGPTSALFASVLEYGSEEEKEATKDGSISPFFEGKKGSYIHSVTGIAGAYNGTSLITNKQAIDDTVIYLRKYFPLYKYDPLCKLLEKAAAFFGNLTDGTEPDPDTGLYDMIPDRSVSLNKTIRTVKDIYYFTVPCCTTYENSKKNASVPDMKITDYFFAPIAEIMGMTDMTTPDGLELRKEWQPNDGLVNTVSEYGPMNEEKTFLSYKPNRKAAGNCFEKGRYYVFETNRGSHNSLCGGTVRPNKKAKEYLTDLIAFINSL